MFFSDPGRLETALVNVIFEAHTRTSLFTKEKIQEAWKRGINQQKLFAFKNMVSQGKGLKDAADIDGFCFFRPKRIFG